MLAVVVVAVFSYVDNPEIERKGSVSRGAEWYFRLGAFEATKWSLARQLALNNVIASQCKPSRDAYTSDCTITMHTAIISHGDVDKGPTETYGQGEVLLRIGSVWI